MKSSAILALLAEAEPGRCPLCDERLPPGRPKYCGSRDCNRLYVKLYGSDWKRDRYAKRGHCRGEAHPLAKLDPEKVRRIRELGAQRVPHRKIAAAFGISMAQAARIIHGLAWAHVPLFPAEAK